MRTACAARSARRMVERAGNPPGRIWLGL